MSKGQVKRILALDISSHTGWAAGHPEDDKPSWGELELPYQGENIGKPMAWFADWLDDFITVNGTQMVSFEAPFSQKKRAIDARKLLSLAGVVEMVSFKRGIACREISITDNKAFFTGHARASKTEMVQMAKLYGWHVRTDNEADALALWAYTVNWRYPRIFQERYGLAAMGANRK